jgi:hypothetical protein
MNIQYKAKYTAGGYPNPTYEGTHQTGVNVELNDAHAKDIALSKARKEIARELACEPVYVRINTIEEIR